MAFVGETQTETVATQKQDADRPRLPAMTPPRIRAPSRIDARRRFDVALGGTALTILRRRPQLSAA